MADRLFLAWQDQETRRWHTVGLLTAKDDTYEFTFTEGAKHLRSVPANLFGMQPGKRFVSDRLMPLFKNKIPPRNRSDFEKIAHWVGLKGDEDEFSLLSKFGLIPGSDGLMVYPAPKVESGRYTVDFFVHGIRHMHDDAADCCSRLEEGDVLLPMLDVKNHVDPSAIALRSEPGNIILGYAPTFYANDLYRILRDQSAAQSAEITVLKKNPDAPIQLRLMCRFTASVETSFEPLDTEDHQMFLPATRADPQSPAKRRSSRQHVNEANRGSQPPLLARP